MFHHALSMKSSVCIHRIGLGEYILRNIMPKYTIKYIPSSCLLIFKQIASNEAEYTFLCIGGGGDRPHPDDGRSTHTPS